MNLLDLLGFQFALIGDVLRIRSLRQMETKCVDLTIENRVLIQEKTALHEDNLALKADNTALKLKVEQLEAEIRNAHQNQPPPQSRREYNPYENI